MIKNRKISRILLIHFGAVIVIAVAFFIGVKYREYSYVKLLNEITNIRFPDFSTEETITSEELGYLIKITENNDDDIFLSGLEKLLIRENKNFGHYSIYNSGVVPSDLLVPFFKIIGRPDLADRMIRVMAALIEKANSYEIYLGYPDTLSNLLHKYDLSGVSLKTLKYLEKSIPTEKDYVLVLYDKYRESSYYGKEIIEKEVYDLFTQINRENYVNLLSCSYFGMLGYFQEPALSPTPYIEARDLVRAEIVLRKRENGDA